MNGVTFIRGNGGLARRLPGEDHISGMIAVVGEASPLAGKYELRTVEAAEAAGFTATAAPVLHYHISEFFRLAPGAILFVMAVEELDGTFTEIKQLQQHTGGKLRRVGIAQPDVVLSTVITQAATVDAICTELAGLNMPLVAVLTGHVTSANIASLTDLHTKNCPRVGICIAQDGGGYGAYLQSQPAHEGQSVGAMGALLGALAKRRVSDSIGWVEKYNVVSTAYPKSLTGGDQKALELDVPALCDGTLISDLTPAQLQSINEKGYILLFRHVGYSGSYWNDAFAATALTSDYAYLENSETMDKACRGVYLALLPKVSGPAYVDPATGNLAESTCKSLETLAEVPLAQMEREGELSGGAVSIDPAQPVLSTSRLQVVIKLVPVGTLREIVVTIGFTLNIES
jgi:hypothetical protein